jgi:hypothetical protein
MISRSASSATAEHAVRTICSIRTTRGSVLLSCQRTAGRAILTVRIDRKRTQEREVVCVVPVAITRFKLRRGPPGVPIRTGELKLTLLLLSLRTTRKSRPSSELWRIAAAICRRRSPTTGALSPSTAEFAGTVHAGNGNGTRADR